MKITNRIREEAAVLCAGFASTPEAYSEWNMSDAEASATTCREAVKLSDSAYWHVASELRLHDRDAPTEAHLEAYAEAECLLRTGWVPS